jgi:hypothetical protein
MAVNLLGNGDKVNSTVSVRTLKLMERLAKMENGKMARN